MTWYSADENNTWECEICKTLLSKRLNDYNIMEEPKVKKRVHNKTK